MKSGDLNFNVTDQKKHPQLMVVIFMILNYGT
nr:MAG TPA: hypothetical protein [Caudoviricetes sp.]